MTDTSQPTASTTILDRLWPELVAAVPGILASQDRTTGRFGTEPFIVQDQNLLWPLALVWATPSTESRPNPYAGDPTVLAAVVAGGDALIDVSDANGQWEFRKKDNSTWGQIHMPWTYSRWIRAWALVRDAMPADRRAAWDAMITTAVDGIVATELARADIKNIPAHHAMGVFRASQVLGRDDWREAAVSYLHRTVADQDPAGFWSEHHGPVVRYNVVYVEALGCYHGMSGDPAVLPALERAAEFHANLTYPDGTQVETIDERNPYGHEGSAISAGAAGFVGFLANPVGRGYLAWLLERANPDGSQTSGIAPDAIASMIAYGADGPQVPPAAAAQHRSFVLGEQDARTERRAPWYVALSAYHCEPWAGNRWIQDRQAHLSVFHDRVGLVLSGSNGRMQPRWSTVTVGDVSLLAHTPGDENPDFAARPGLSHLPRTAALAADGLGVDLVHEFEGAAVEVDVRVALDDEAARVSYQLTTPSPAEVAAHLAFYVHPGEAWSTGGSAAGVIGDDPVRLTGAECGGWLAHHGWRITVPEHASIDWPVYGHNPYAKDGSAGFGYARLVMSVPLGTEPGTAEVAITVD